MPITPETLLRHELVGLETAVVSASNTDLAGTAGEVVTETTRTLGLAGADRVRTVPKAGATFEFALPDDDTRVVVDGRRLLGRPARRTEQTGDSTWR